MDTTAEKIDIQNGLDQNLINLVINKNRSNQIFKIGKSLSYLISLPLHT